MASKPTLCYCCMDWSHARSRGGEIARTHRAVFCRCRLLMSYHAQGDSPAPFAQLARSLRLPQTSCFALRAPLALPLELGWAWFPAFEDDGTGAF